MNYRKASASDILDFRKLWEEVFGDSEDYIQLFISHFGIENGYICVINGKIVAMAFAIPTALFLGSKFKSSRVQEFKYLYACATHPDFQSQGIMTKLLETIYEYASMENFKGIFLQAANPDLANYYRKLGFEDFFFRGHSFYYNHKEHKELPQRTQRADAVLNLCAFASLREKTFNIITPEKYQEKRVEMLANNCFVSWNKNFFNFLYESGTQFCEYKNTIFSFKTSGKNIIVDESLGDAPHEQIADLLFEKLPDFDVVHIRSIGNEFCCGQIKWCSQTKNHPKEGWLGFAME